MQRADGHDGVIPCVRQRLLQQISEDACDIGRRYPPGLFDHGRRAVQGVDAFRSLGQVHGESSGTTADIKHPLTWTGQVPQAQALSDCGGRRACLRARSSSKPPAITVTGGQEPRADHLG
jgi:hypothetical protein